MELKKIDGFVTTEKDADGKSYHVYAIGGKKYGGVTSLLSRKLYPNEFAGIPEDVMAAATQRGTDVHEDIEFADTNNFRPHTPEGRNYRALMDIYKLERVANEYMVCDFVNIASKIDLVVKGEGYSENEFGLIDFKTCYAINLQKVRWQLSIYAYMFETVNKGAQISHLFVMHLRGEKRELIEVNRIPDAFVSSLLKADVCGEAFSDPFAPVQSTEQLPAMFAEAEAMVVALEQQKKEAVKRSDALKAAFLEYMESHNIKKFDSPLCTITLKNGGVRVNFDSAKLKNDDPITWAKYKNETKVKNSVTINIK